MIYDISPLLSSETRVWPDDTPLTRDLRASLEAGDPCTVSTLKTTVHIGAHSDAPAHFGRGEATIDEVPLEPYLGPCQVIRVHAEPPRLITPEMLPAPLAAPRVLFATSSYGGDPTAPFTALSRSLIEMIHEQGGQLVGLDTPSVDPANSQDFPVHLACIEFGIATIEGLVLDQVPEGIYELIALPLKLAGFDASPVRAVLRTLP